MEVSEINDVCWTSELTADIMTQACKDYRFYKTVLYGIRKGKFKYGDNKAIIEKYTKEIERIKQYIKRDPYDVLKTMTADDLIFKMDFDFCRKKDKYLQKLLKKQKKEGA